MNPEARLVPHTSQDELARETARRVIEVLEQAQDERGEASVVLTGGGMGIAVLLGTAAALSPRWLDEAILRVHFARRYITNPDHAPEVQAAARDFVARHFALYDQAQDVQHRRVLGRVAEHPVPVAPHAVAFDGADHRTLDGGRFAEELGADKLLARVVPADGGNVRDQRHGRLAFLLLLRESFAQELLVALAERGQVSCLQ